MTQRLTTEQKSDLKSKREVRIKGLNIGDETAKQIAKFLSRHSCPVEELRIRGKIGDIGAKYLSHALITNTSLTYLSIGENGIGDEGAKYLSEALSNPACTLQQLYLYGNNIGDDGVRYLCTSLQHNTSLAFLDLKYNKFEEAGANALLNLLSTNRTISKVWVKSRSKANLQEKFSDQIATEIEELSRVQRKISPRAFSGIQCSAECPPEMLKSIEVKIKEGIHEALVSQLPHLMNEELEKFEKDNKSMLSVIQNNIKVSLEGVFDRIDLQHRRFHDENKLEIQKLADENANLTFHLKSLHDLVLSLQHQNNSLIDHLKSVSPSTFESFIPPSLPLPSPSPSPAPSPSLSSPSPSSS